MHFQYRGIRAMAALPAVLAALILGHSQDPEEGRPRRGTITGRVVEAQNQRPIEYASIVVLEQDGKTMVTGTSTQGNGYFRLSGIKPGRYSLRITFIGFSMQTRPLMVDPDRPDLHVGTIQLEQVAVRLDETRVTAEKPAITFKIDKKVINVSKSYTSTSGTAVDVLENVPSVSVDVEGNVSLRGSTNFTVLIDSRPTLLEPSDALQQIPASTIENIEIITNPSAKYDPTGASGIINVITKKNQGGGLSGTVNLKGGLDDKYGTDFLINYRAGRSQTHFGVDYNNNNFPGRSETESQTSSGDTTTLIRSRGTSSWGGRFYGLKGGVDFYPSPNDIASLGGEYRDRGMTHSSTLDFETWTTPLDGYERQVSRNSEEHGGNSYSLTGDYQHNFEIKEHKLMARATASRHEGDEQSLTELLDAFGTVTSGHQSTEGGPRSRVRLNVDYDRPLGPGHRLEAGYQSNIDRTENALETSSYDTLSGRYVFQSAYSHSVEYTHDVHAAYATYAGEWRRLGYQGGLRGEYTFREMMLIGETGGFKLDRIDFFPTVHGSYELPARLQLMASYARRIRRPRDFDLQPFLTWSDAYNVQRGNPALMPEFIDAYDLAAQKRFGRNLVSLETYYRQTHNKIEHVRSVYQSNVILHSSENVGTDYTYGAELMLELDLLRWFNLSLTGNLYDYRVEGRLYGEPFSQESNNWSIRANNTFRVGPSTRLQINGIYNSPTVTAQGRREGFMITNAAVRQELIKGALTATLQVRDILGTAKFESTSEGPGFYSHSEGFRKSPVVMLALNYNFNNYKPKREGEEGIDEFEGEEE